MSISLNNNIRDSTMVAAGALGVIHLATTAYKGTKEAIYQTGKIIFNPELTFKFGSLLDDSDYRLVKGTPEYLTKYNEMFPDNMLYPWNKKTLVLSVISLASIYFGFNAMVRLTGK